MSEFIDSGITWIGDIPSTWKINKIKAMSSLSGRIGWQGLTSDEYTDEGAYLITGVDFESGKINWDSCVHVPMKRWKEATGVQIRENDLLITKDGTVGKVALVKNMPYETSLNSGVLLIRADKEYDNKFLFYILQSDVFWTWFNLDNAGNSTIIHLYQHSFNNFSFPYPNLKEQKRIADFLDAKVKNIDGVISDIEDQIAILKKHKKALISELVTQNNGHDIKKSIESRWFPEIPSNWIVKRLKDVFDVVSGNGFPDDLQGNDTGDIPFCKCSDINGQEKDVSTAANYISKEILIKNAFNLIPKDSIVFAKIGEAMKKNNRKINRVNCCLDNNAQALIPKIPVSIDYMYYVLCNIDMSEYDNGGPIPCINNLKMMLQLVPFPTIEMQKSIARNLDIKTSNINELIKQKENALISLEDYKKSLIYEYVTGKKRVEVK